MIPIIKQYKQLLFTQIDGNINNTKNVSTEHFPQIIVVKHTFMGHARQA